MRRKPGRRPIHTAPIILGIIVTLIASPSAAASSDVMVNVAIPGGLAALARALGIDPPDRALCVPHLTRVIYGGGTQRAKKHNLALESLLAHLRSVGPVQARDAGRGAADELVPIPLPAAVWSQAVFRSAVAPAGLFAAVMSDERAALLAHGLYVLDDETLRFVASHPAIVARLYELGAPAFSGFAEHLRIRGGRVVPPGGDAAVHLWEGLVGEKVSRPEAFIPALFVRDKGRLAYLYDTIGHLDPPQAAFALGLWMTDRGQRAQRFEALAATAVSAFSEWDVRKVPFSRPTHDLLALLTRVQAAPDGTPRFPSSRGVWRQGFDDADRFDDWTGDAAPQADDSHPVDAAWLADAVISEHGPARADSLDQLAFGHRRFAGVDATTLPDVIAALRGFRRFRMLMLTLDRISVDRPAIYAAHARHADRLSALDADRRGEALAQFQGAVALVARLVRVRTIDLAQAEPLLRALAAVPLDPKRGYTGALAVWVRQELGPAIGVPAGHDMDDVLVDALAGARGVIPAVPVEWEGQQYQFDLVRSEAMRLRRAREERPHVSIDMALHLLHNPREQRGTVAAEPSLGRVDSLLAGALLALSYAIDWSDARGLPGMAATVSRRHDFGLGKSSQVVRLRAAWALPKRTFPRGSPWHVEGSLLGLDVALAPLALRRVSTMLPSREPVLSSNERHTFITSLGLMNPFTLRDATAEAIARAVARGGARVEALAQGNEDVSGVAREVGMDGGRTRALQWTITHDPQRARSLFATADLLRLGGGEVADFDAWGMSVLDVRGSLGTRLAPPAPWNALAGRPQLGLLATAVADLNLHVAIALHDLRLPAALAKSVLASAVQDYIDEVAPFGPDDWLTMVRGAQGVSRNRIEDYIATATVSGVLLPVTTTQ